MGMFKCNDNIQSYAWPISKIALCGVLIFLIINRNSIVRIESSLLNTMVKIVCLGEGIVAILCVYISIAEIVLLHERRKRQNTDVSFSSECINKKSVDEIVTMLVSNDILEITTVLEGQIIQIGVSSDTRPGSSDYFDKHYYIGDRDYTEVVDFKVNLNDYYKHGEIGVVAIDGMQLREM